MGGITRSGFVSSNAFLLFVNLFLLMMSVGYLAVVAWWGGRDIRLVEKAAGLSLFMGGILCWGFATGNAVNVVGSVVVVANVLLFAAPLVAVVGRPRCGRWQLTCLQKEVLRTKNSVALPGPICVMSLLCSGAWCAARGVGSRS